MEINAIVKIARTELVQLTGFTSPAAIGINKEAETWHITIEIIEKPSKATNLDLLGIYDIRIDASGKLLGYERIRTRKRCES